MTSSDDEKQPNDVNRAKGNYNHSGGPRSDAGKKIASQNSTKHGILSTHLLLREENPADFDILIEQLREALKPVGAFEEFQVERIAVGIWRQRRLVRAETEQIERQRVQLRAEVRLLYIEAFELLVRDLNARVGSDKTLEQEAKKLFAAFQAEYSIYKELIHNTDIKDWELLADKAPNIWALLLTEAEKKGLTVTDLLNGYTSIDEWAKATMANQNQALRGLERISAQGQATNSQSNGASDVSKRGEGLPEKNTVNTVMKSRWIPSNMEVLGRYQTMLDNQVYKAMKALFDAQEARREEKEYTGADKIVAEHLPEE